MRKDYNSPIPEPEIDPTLVDPQFARTERRIARLRSALERRQPDLRLVLENVHDPHNVSAVLRSCDAVGVGAVHLVYTFERFPKIGRASSASAYKWTTVVQHDSIAACYESLRAEGCRIYATDLTERSENLYDVDLASPVALVFGNEHLGVSEDASRLADGNIRIPMVGLIQSLNISVACAVTLYEAMRQRSSAGLYDTPSMAPDELEATLAEWAQR